MIDNCIGRSCVSLALVEIPIYPFGVNELHQTLVKIKEIKSNRQSGVLTGTMTSKLRGLP